MQSGDGYDHGACMVAPPEPPAEAPPTFHDRCVCKSWTWNQCKEACDGDSKCKGFVEWDEKALNRKGCDIATSSGGCAPGCDSKTGKGGAKNHKVGKLQRASWDESLGINYCGCFLKVCFWI